MLSRSVDSFSEWMEVDSNHRSNLQQIYSLSPLATRESIHLSKLISSNKIVLYFISKKKARGFLKKIEKNLIVILLVLAIVIIKKRKDKEGEQKS